MNYPLSYSRLKDSGRIRYGHLASVVLALTFPLVGALVHLKDGYFAARNPTIICTGRNTDYTYYTFVLPICIVLGITSYELILTGWKILKVRDLESADLSALKFLQFSGKCAVWTPYSVDTIIGHYASS